MSPERFDHLHRLTAPMLTKNCTNRTPVSPRERLAVTLRYLATGDSQRSIAFNFVLGRQTVGRIIAETCLVISHVLKTYISFPESEAQWRAISQDYVEKWQFPHIIGALDGKHVMIQAPANSGSDYYNYKNFFSINLMAMCDAHYKFTYVDIGSYGRDNDSAVFSRTSLCNALENDTIHVPAKELLGDEQLPFVVLGDEIFPLKSWLLKPYPGKNLTEPQAVFNYRLSRARRTIENAFGILSSRWRVLRRPIKANVDLVVSIVQATTSLHNYLLSTDSARYSPDGFTDSYSSSGEFLPGDWRKQGDGTGVRAWSSQGTHNYTLSAKQIRDKFCDYVNSDTGQVSWQIDHVRSTS